MRRQKLPGPYKRAAQSGRIKPGLSPGKKKDGPSAALNRSPKISASLIYYLAYSDGKKCIFGEEDAFLLTGGSRLPGPENLSFTQLFINGILQPRGSYELKPGRLRLKTRELPAAGVPILLQGIRLKLTGPGTKRRRSRSRRKGKRGAGASPVPGKRSFSYDKTCLNKKEGEANMPPSLIKPFAVATSTITGTITTTTDTDVVDAVTRLNATVTADMIDAGAGTTTIPAASFVTDAGEPLAGAIPVVTPGGSTNLFVNGILQQAGLYTVTATELTITSAAILAGTPVNLEMHDYSGTTSTSASTPNLTVTTDVDM